MFPFKYHRPKTAAEALELLDRGVPLAGGSELMPRRDEVSAVIDIRELGLDYTEPRDDGFVQPVDLLRARLRWFRTSGITCGCLASCCWL
jgi:hypothetical protein